MSAAAAGRGPQPPADGEPVRWRPAGDPDRSDRRLGRPKRRFRRQLRPPPQSLSKRRLASLRGAFAERRAAADRGLRARAGCTSSPTATTASPSPASATHTSSTQTVTVLHSDYELPIDVDIARLVHTEQQRADDGGERPRASRPEATIDFARPRGYPELTETIKAHGYDLGRERGELPPAEEVAADWYDRVFAPGVAAVHRAGLPRPLSVQDRSRPISLDLRAPA